MRGDSCLAERMESLVNLLDRSLERDLPRRSDWAQASERNCKGNLTGAWPNVRNLAIVYRAVRTKHRLQPSRSSQMRYASFCRSPDSWLTTGFGLLSSDAASRQSSIH